MTASFVRRGRRVVRKGERRQERSLGYARDDSEGEKQIPHTGRWATGFGMTAS